jgi:hypothetical protein
MSFFKVNTSTRKGPRNVCFMKCVQHSPSTSLQSFNAPPNPCAHVGPPHLHNHPLNPSVLKSSTNLLVRNQVRLCHPRLNTLLQNSQHSSKERCPTRKHPTLYVAIMKKVTKLHRSPMLQGRLSYQYPYRV